MGSARFSCSLLWATDLPPGGRQPRKFSQQSCVTSCQASPKPEEIPATGEWGEREADRKRNYKMGGCASPARPAV